MAGLCAAGAGLMLVLGGGVSATVQPTTAAPTTTVAPTATTLPAVTALPTTTALATTTTTAPPVDLLAGVPWIQRTFASPCSETAVQMVGGSAIDGPSLAVIDDVLPIDRFAGLALAFLSCHAADGTTTETTALVVRVGPRGNVASVAEQELGHGRTSVAVDLRRSRSSPRKDPVGGSCCAPFVRRRTYTVAPHGFDVTGEHQVAAFLQTVSPPVVGGDGDLVRANIPAAALCYPWDDVYLTPRTPPTPRPPSASRAPNCRRCALR